MIDDAPKTEPTFMTLAEMQLKDFVAKSSIQDPEKSQIMGVIETAGYLRKVALQRFESMKEMAAEIKKLKGEK